LVTDWHSRTSAGREFQTDGATAMEKAPCREMSGLVLGTTSIGNDDEYGVHVGV